MYCTIKSRSNRASYHAIKLSLIEKPITKCYTLNMEARTWGILNRFKPPVSVDNIQFKPTTLQQPPGVDQLIRADWEERVSAKQAELAQAGDVMEIRPYHRDLSERPLSALYKREEAKMWPGPAITLIDISQSITRPKIILHVAQTSFPFIAELKNPEVSRLYKEAGINIPRPSLAICTFAITLDGQLTLTVRGMRTNMYPGRKYGQGGNPLFTSTDILQHQRDEMVDEILVDPSKYNPREFQFGGIAEDQEELPGKPDLISWVPVNLTSDDIKEGVLGRENHPNDAVDVAFVSSDAEALQGHLATEDPHNYCPPAFAGLILYGSARYGSLWEQDLLKELSRK